MPLQAKVGRAFRILELSLSAQLKQLALTILGMDSEKEREDSAVLACQIMEERFTEFTGSELMWHLCGHIDRIKYERQEKDLCDLSDAATEEVNRLDMQIHVLATELGQANRDLTALKKGNIRTGTDKGYYRAQKTNAKRKPKKGKVMKAMKEPYDIAFAASWDEGNRSMRKAGRIAWNEDDSAAACREFERLMKPETDNNI
jgi:hypothetical protein